MLSKKEESGPKSATPGLTEIHSSPYGLAKSPEQMSVIVKMQLFGHTQAGTIISKCVICYNIGEFHNDLW